MGKGISMKLLRAQQREPPRPSRRLDQELMFKAARALLKHINIKLEERRANSDKPNLLASNPDDVEDEDDVPIFLILTTKTHIVNKKRLKPGKITIPHTLYSPASTICLITVDPHRAFKDAMAHPSFPESLRKRITRVIGVGKLREKYKSYESRRQLHREHDIFLADDRVLSLLPRILGKAFYRGSAKRPVPVCLSGGGNDRQNLKEGENSIAKPATIADQIERTLSTALVHLSPTTSTSIRVGRASWDERLVVENMEAVVDGLIRTFISRKWRGIKALHIKGPSTTALPFYMTKELWVDEKDIIDGDDEAKALGARDEDENDMEGVEQSGEDGERTTESTERKKKRKRKDDEAAADGHDKEVGKAKKKIKKEEDDDEDNAERSEKERKKEKRVSQEDGGVDINENEKEAKEGVTKEQVEEGTANGHDRKVKKAKKNKKDKKGEDGLDKETAIRKERLKKQKAEAMADVD